MPKSILIKNSFCCAPMNSDRPSNGWIKTFTGGYIYIENGIIKSIGKDSFDCKADIEIDASRMVVLPGFINTHHHLFQTLTRNIFSTQETPLFNWLLTNYEIWRELTAEGTYISAKLGIAELLKSGCTTTSDHLYLFPKSSNSHLIDEEIKAAKEMGIRFQPTRGSMSLGKSVGGLPPEDVIQSESEIMLDIKRLIKLYHDDSFGAMIRISLAPCSPFSVTPELMRKTVQFSNEYNLQIHTHLAETLEEQEFCLKNYGIRPFELIKNFGWARANVWLAHAIYLNDEEIKEIGDTGMGISHCPSSNMRLGSGIARIHEMIDAGANVSLAVDGSASNDSSNMLIELRNALLLSHLRSRENWLTVDDILWMATRGGAAVLGRDDIGQIAPGKCADINLISIDRLEYSGGQHDPLAAIIFSVSMNPVDWVIVNGKVVVAEGKLKDIEEPSLIQKHQRISNQMVKDAEQRTGKQLTRPRL